MQVKLLRVLDTSQVHPIGAPNAVPVDFRAVAATNANLHELIEQKRFREDPFYRLNVATSAFPHYANGARRFCRSSITFSPCSAPSTVGRC